MVGVVVLTHQEHNPNFNTALMFFQTAPQYQHMVSYSSQDAHVCTVPKNIPSETEFIVNLRYQCQYVCYVHKSLLTGIIMFFQPTKLNCDQIYKATC